MCYTVGSNRENGKEDGYILQRMSTAFILLSSFFFLLILRVNTDTNYYNTEEIPKAYSLISIYSFIVYETQMPKHYGLIPFTSAQYSTQSHLSHERLVNTHIQTPVWTSEATAD